MLKKMLNTGKKIITSIINMFIATIGMSGWAWLIYDSSDFVLDYWDGEDFICYLIIIPCMLRTIGLITKIITKEVKTNKE